MRKTLKLLLAIFALANLQVSQATAGNFLAVESTADFLHDLENLPHNAIIFIDIDDTIITPVSKTFRQPPYNRLIDDIKKNKNKYPNYEQIISNWRLQRKVMLLDEDWLSALGELQSKFAVYGLTKMDPGKLGNIESMEEWRYQELKALGIQFSTNSNLPQQGSNDSIFYKGIFMTGNNSKSQTLFQYLPYLQTNTIVVIDDRQEHLEDIERFCEQHSITFVGIYFRGLEKLQDKPDPSIAAFQRQYLITHSQWLEDEEAVDHMTKALVCPASF